MATNVAEVRLGDLFVREGLIDAKQLQDALNSSTVGQTMVLRNSQGCSDSAISQQDTTRLRPRHRPADRYRTCDRKPKRLAATRPTTQRTVPSSDMWLMAEHRLG